MKLKNLILCLSLALCVCACSNDDEPGNDNGNQPENSSEITINPDGSTSTKAVFSVIDETSFYIDYIKYSIVDSHLEITGYDNLELKGDIKPYATVKYMGTVYNTRVIGDEAFACSKITSIIIPETVTKVHGYAFAICELLSSMVIPASVSDLRFAYRLPSLKDVWTDNSNDDERLVSWYIEFGGTNGEYRCEIYENATLHVPADRIEWYKSNYPWKRFSKIVGDYKPKKK